MLTKFGAAIAGVVALLLLGSITPLSADSANTPTYSDLLIRFQPQLASTEIAAALAARGLELVERDDDLNVVRARGSNRAALSSARRSLAGDPRVQLVEPNYVVQAQGTRVWRVPPLLPATAAFPNDPYFDYQWGVRKISAPRAWTVARGGELRIAVIDSGIDIAHPDLRAHTLTGVNYITPGKPPRDDYYHGTVVSGIAAAVVNNRIGISGVAPDVKILPLKILDAGGSGTLQDLARALRYAARHGARIVNMSLGTLTDDNRCPQILREQLTFAHAQGVLLVAAAGNQGGFLPFFPAACYPVVAVTSSDEGDQLSWFDNTGRWIDLTAPGENILSTWPGGYYDFGSGTSMATPFVSAAAALVWANRPGASPTEVERILERSAERFGARGHTDTYGWGRLNAARAVGAER